MGCSQGCCESQLAHYRSVSIAASACPSREAGRYAASLNAREKRWQKDFAAVKELKRDGIVPRSTDGAADLVARAETRYEIERGKTIPKDRRSRIADVMGQDIT